MFYKAWLYQFLERIVTKFVTKKSLTTLTPFPEKIITTPLTKKPLTTLAPLLDTRIHKSDNTVVLAPLNAGNSNENTESSSR